ncbi:hypothetical protein CR513_03382, partial [Mucuna pruriens]
MRKNHERKERKIKKKKVKKNKSEHGNLLVNRKEPLFHLFTNMCFIMDTHLTNLPTGSTKMLEWFKDIFSKEIPYNLFGKLDRLHSKSIHDSYKLLCGWLSRSQDKWKEGKGHPRLTIPKSMRNYPCYPLNKIVKNNNNKWVEFFKEVIRLHKTITPSSSITFREPYGVSFTLSCSLLLLVIPRWIDRLRQLIFRLPRLSSWLNDNGSPEMARALRIQSTRVR